MSPSAPVECSARREHWSLDIFRWTQKFFPGINPRRDDFTRARPRSNRRGPGRDSTTPDGAPDLVSISTFGHLGPTLELAQCRRAAQGHGGANSAFEIAGAWFD